MKINEAVILVGGRGTRLNPITNSVPKPLVDINGKPFLYYLIEQLKYFKINNVTLLTGYKSLQFKEFKKKYNRKFNINLITQPEDYETGARLVHAKNKLPKNFILLYGDNYCGLNLRNLIKNFHKFKRNFQLTAYYDWNNYSRPNIDLNKDYSIKTYDSKRKSRYLKYVDVGYMCINKKILDNFKFSKKLSLSSHIIPNLVKNNKAHAYKTYNLYCTVGNMERLMKTRTMLSNRKFIFIDRDGVLNVKPKKGKYIKSSDQIIWKKGSLNALKRLKKMKYETILVTNQAGIGRKLFKEKDLNEVHNYMCGHVRKFGGSIDYIYFCPHHWIDNCFCRKPKPGLFLKAQFDLHLDFSKIKFIGDQNSDLIAAQNLDIDFIKIRKNDSLLNKINKL